VFTLRGGAVDQLHLFMRGIPRGGYHEGREGFRVWRSNLKESPGGEPEAGHRGGPGGGSESLQGLPPTPVKVLKMSACGTGTFCTPVFVEGGRAGGYGVGCYPYSPPTLTGLLDPRISEICVPGISFLAYSVRPPYNQRVTALASCGLCHRRRPHQRSSSVP
jgi:hypothetical protein